MRAVLLIAHGSKNKGAKEEIFNLTRKLGDMMAEKFEMVSCAFLERATPSVREKLDQIIDKGTGDILIIPYLLATGRHVVVDIPDLVAEFEQKYPAITFTVMPHIGSSKEMPVLIYNHVEAVGMLEKK